VIFNTEYFNTLDRGYYQSKGGLYVDTPIEKEPVVNLGPREIGSSEADIGQGTPLQKFDAAIRQGSAKVEFTFFGKGKSGGGQHTPESIGKIEREQIRELANVNNAKFSVHATPNIGGASGLTREGFSEEARMESYREISKAIEFAADASTGGAVVFHTGEWQRPIVDIKSGMFKEYPTEEKRSPVYVVDNRTGEIKAFRRDHRVFQPKFHTAETYGKETGKKFVGTKDKKNGFIVQADDWIDMEGNVIKHEWLFEKGKTDELFNRIPVWNKEKTNFMVEEKTFEDFETEAKKYNQDPGVFFMKSQTANQVLQYKGNSLFHGAQYDQLTEKFNALQESLDFYNKLDENTPDDEKWRLMTEKRLVPNGLGAPKNIPIKEYLQEEVKEVKDRMRHIHESSASADAMAIQAQRQMEEFVTLEQFGMKKTAETISDLGIKAMIVSKKRKADLKEDIYIAPESFMPQMYGSHPDEIRDVIETSRKAMAETLQRQGYGRDEAKDLAKRHIKATLDTGHFNMWRKYMQPKEGEKPEDAEKRFEKWYLDETEKLAKDGIVGHIHLTDNFGYDDEHVTPGQGNVPIKEFMKRMEKAGMKDFIVERGGDNPDAMWHFLSDMGSPIYGLKNRMNFSQVRHGSFGYAAPANYIVGAYAPSNEWRLWSEVPLE